jgi:hypothetical protein
VELPALKVEPAAILKAVLIVQPTAGLIAAVLLMFSVAKVGEDRELKTGATVPLKFAVLKVVAPLRN